MQEYHDAALRLHQHLIDYHWDGSVLVGPDPIGKIHWRITRFVRSYLPWLPGDDRYIYLQGLAYWIRDNIALYNLTGETRYLDIVNQCASHIVATQPANGAWLHPPIRGRVGFISTVEGAWGALGLAAAYQATGEQAYLAGAQKWYEFQVNESGFQSVEDGLAANYYAHSNSRVPNVTTMTVWLSGELYRATTDEAYLEYTDKMLRFVEYSQLDSGELPYALERIHFMCFQYNAFQFLDLAYYYDITGDERTYKILKRLAAFLATGMTDRGSCRYNCFKEFPEINYWTAALAAALRKAHHLGLGNYLALSERGYQYLLTRQRADGAFDFSERTYGLLTDKRSYPRQLSMTLNHLLSRTQMENAKG